MLDRRIALLSGLLWLAGCEAAGESVVVPERPRAPKSVVEAPKVEPEPEAREDLGVVEPAASGECPTSESCVAAASDEERRGHLERAAPLYARACDLGLGQACHRLGELYRDGKGVAPDDDRAHALFEQGCRQGSNGACDALGH